MRTFKLSARLSGRQPDSKCFKLDQRMADQEECRSSRCFDGFVAPLQEQRTGDVAYCLLSTN